MKAKKKLRPEKAEKYDPAKEKEENNKLEEAKELIE
jgi:hypothetical protein